MFSYMQSSINSKRTDVITIPSKCNQDIAKETKVTLIKEKTEKKVIQKFNLFDIFIYLQP